MTYSSLRIAAAAIAAAVPLLCLAQEEPDRPAGEATRAMVRHHRSTWRPDIFPTPQEVHDAEKKIPIGATLSLEVSLPGEAARLTLLEPELRKRLGRNFAATKGSGVRVIFALSPWDLPAGQERLSRDLDTVPEREGYVLATTTIEQRPTVIVLGKSEAALWRALPTVAQLFEKADGRIVLPEVQIVDYPQMQSRSLLVDLGGQGFMVGSARWEFEQWREFVDWMVDQKFNELWLEFIGSGRLMGNLDPAKGEWIGFPLELKTYPQLVCRDRPIRRWDAQQGRVVEDRFTAPNVRKEFTRELIDYAQARGVKCVLLVGYDYFANQLPFVLGVPANDPGHRGANKVYDAILREIVERYDNAQGVAFITIENKNVPPEMVHEVIRRMHEGRAIVRSINPRMEVAVLNDYLEWRPRSEFDTFAAGVPHDLTQLYAPHTAPQNKSWKRIYGDVIRYELFSQYAWNHVAYIFPERVKRELQESYINGYRKILTQAWYADVFLLNYRVMAEMAWNSTGRPLEETWDKMLGQEFGEAAREDMRTALAHTRFDIRSDIVSRMILQDRIERPFQFWDMYTLSNIDGLKDEMLAALEADARASLEAARRAAGRVDGPRAQEMLEVVLTSAERRLHLATSARHFVRAHFLNKSGDRTGAIAAMDACLAEGAKLERAATRMGIEFPMATHDDEVVAHYRETRKKYAGESK